MTLAQVTGGMVEAVDTASSSVTVESLSLFDLLKLGGFTMIPLLLLSILTVYIFVERIMSINKAGKDPHAFMEKVKERVLEGDVAGARVICKEEQSPISSMIEKGLSRIGNPLKNISVTIENVGRVEIYNLEKNLTGLATIASAAPMIGFFGTVVGMIKTFMRIKGKVDIEQLADGIYTALITTATGLAIGIIAMLAYNYLVSRVQKVIHRMEYTSVEFMDLLQEPHHNR